ncbi:hypothetical protein BG000_006717 [Podila horticola]|nr:hypothetical protein BG000_006717 [Podila horticola]
MPTLTLEHLEILQFGRMLVDNGRLQVLWVGQKHLTFNDRKLELPRMSQQTKSLWLRGPKTADVWCCQIGVDRERRIRVAFIAGWRLVSGGTGHGPKDRQEDCCEFADKVGIPGEGLLGSGLRNRRKAFAVMMDTEDHSRGMTAIDRDQQTQAHWARSDCTALHKTFSSSSTGEGLEKRKGKRVKSYIVYYGLIALRMSKLASTGREFAASGRLGDSQSVVSLETLSPLSAEELAGTGSRVE